jgi:DNA repair protein RadC
MEVRNLPFGERPRERCLEHGARALSLRECLSVILGSPSTAERILLRFASLEMPDAEAERAFFIALEAQGADALSDVRRLGPAGTTRLLASFEIARRYHLYKKKTGSPWKFRSSGGHSRIALRTLAKIPSPLRSEVREWLGFVPLYRSHEPGELCIVERGVRTHVNTDPAELFARILALRPNAFVLAHNHPSGNREPSDEDQELTRRVAVLSSNLGIQLIGHWIVGPQNATWIETRKL